MLDRVLQTIDAERSETLERLKDFLRIPSVSTKPDHARHMKECAEWLHWELDNIELDARVMPTGGHPIVLAKNVHRTGRPTVLIYGHYDVQPPEPLELWTTPPFEPTVRKDENGYDAIYARGAVDDKGQVWCHVRALAAWQANGGIPVNVTIFVEGEEEIGSPHLTEFITGHKDELRADIAVISDTNQYARGLPAITYGLRGLAYMEITVFGASHDLHSGLYGGTVPNPANVLCELLAALHARDGSVAIPGFYDGVLPLSQTERGLWARLPFDERTFRNDLGLSDLSGELGFSVLERIWARPTCDVNGITSGYQGHGAKTIIPASASAKVSMRLVPNQDPAAVKSAFEAFIRSRLPAGVRVEFVTHSRAPGIVISIESPAMRIASAALRTGFGVEPVLIRGGGSIPVVSQIKSSLGIDTLLVGFGLPDDRVHSPNEKFDMDAFFCGTRTAAALLHGLGELKVT